MDSEAMNYNPDANIDDGYCLYPCECPEIYDPVCAYDSFVGDYVTFNNACEPSAGTRGSCGTAIAPTSRFTDAPTRRR